MRLTVVAARQRTDVVLFDPGNGGGPQQYYVAKIDFADVAPSGGGVGAGSGSAPAAGAPEPSANNAPTSGSGSLPTGSGRQAPASSAASGALYQSPEIRTLTMAFAQATLTGTTVDVTAYAKTTPAYKSATVYTQASALKAAEDKVRSEFAAFDVHRTYRLTTQRGLQQYNDLSHGFPLEITPGTFFPFPDEAQPLPFHLGLDNLDDFSLLPMASAEEAERLGVHIPLGSKERLYQQYWRVVYRAVRQGGAVGGCDIVGCRRTHSDRPSYKRQWGRNLQLSDG